MDLNVGLLTLIGELKCTVLEKNDQIAELVSVNNKLASEMTEIREHNRHIGNSHRTLEQEVSILKHKLLDLAEEQIKDTVNTHKGQPVEEPFKENICLLKRID